MIRTQHILRAVALLGIHATVFAQPQTPSTVLGPGTGQIPLAPVVAAYEPAPTDEAAAEPGRLFRTGTLPKPTPGNLRLLRFSAPGAAAYRLYFDGVALPPGARMFLYGLDAGGSVTSIFGPYEKSGPLAGGSFRSRVIPGIELVVEIQGMNEEPWPMRLPWVASINAGLLAELQLANDPSLMETEEQRRPPSAERVALEVDGKVATAEIIEGQVVVEGDIVVGPATDLEMGIKKSGAGTPRFAVMRTESSGRWPGGVVPFDGALKNDPRVTLAMQSWTTRTSGVITFVPRTNESSFVRFSSTSGNICSSGVGRTSGARVINVAVPCPAGTLIHEVGHALGFHHEQSREDRDQFVKILWDNILDGRENNFDKATGDANSDLSGYDFGSIMHYPLDGFTRNGQNTIQPLVPIPAGVTPGQRISPSNGDVNALNIQYGVRVSATSVQVPSSGGTFSVNIVAPSDRFWVAVDNADWVSVISGGQGTGNGTVTFTVAASVNPGPRKALLRIALTPALLINATVEIVQAPPNCNYSVSPSRINAAAQAGTYSVTVTTGPQCTWGTAEALLWVQLAPASGQGSATVSVKFSPNTTVNKLGVSFKRTGSITVAGKTITVEQEGVCVDCDF